MPRRARITLPQVPLHLIQRGNNRQACFFSDKDYRFYLDWLAEYSDKTGCQVHAYVLMYPYQITFFTQQDKRHHGKPLADWLLHLAREMGLRGATLIPGSEGFGHHGRIHSAHFFELADQPLEVLMAVTGEESEHLFERLKAEGIHLFYVKTPAEFGILGEPDQ